MEPRTTRALPPATIIALTLLPASVLLIIVAFGEYIILPLLLATAFLAVAGITALQYHSRAGLHYANVHSLTGKVLDAMSDAVIVVNGKDVITIFNASASELLGMDENAALGKRVDDLPEPVRLCLVEIFVCAIGSEIDAMCDGRQRRLSVAVSESNGGLEGLVRTAVVRDVTETRLLEREMLRREKQAAMGEFASGMADEFRNPLNAIGNVMQRLLHEFTPKKSAREYRTLTGVLNSEAEQMNIVVQQLLQVTRPTDIHPSSVDMQFFLDHVSSEFAPQVREKGITFSEVNEVAGVWTFDREQMTQAVINLLQNALEATNRGGTIMLNSRIEGSRLSISVSDTGSGIPEDVREKIFNLYFTTKPQGAGLGLPLVHQIVAQHHGTVNFRSEEGKGSTFIITLPAAIKS